MLKRTDAYVIQTEDGILEGRPQGKNLREAIVDHLESLAPDTVLPIDFHKVRFLDFSCADELIAKLVRRIVGGDLSERHILIKNASETLRENISPALTLRQLACIYEGNNGVPELLGKVSPELRETYEFALRRDQFTARDLVAETGKSIAASSNRLARLKSLGLIVWIGSEAGDAGGRQNIFTPLR